MRSGSFPGTNRPGHGVDHPSPSNPEVKEKVELCICSLCGASWPVLRRNFAYLRVAQYSARLIKVCIKKLLEYDLFKVSGQDFLFPKSNM